MVCSDSTERKNVKKKLELNRKYVLFILRDDGIVIAITFWQWVLEFFINIIVIIVMARLGGSRQFDHFVSLTG